jgi:PAS domain S-box-containing protein
MSSKDPDAPAPPDPGDGAAPAAQPDPAEVHRIVADSSHDWEYWSSPSGDFVYCSPSSLRVTGIPAEILMKDSLADFNLAHPDDLAAIKAHHAAMVQSTFAWGELVYRMILPGGELRWMEHRCHPLFDAQGRFLGRRGSVRDITRAKQTEAALLRAQMVLDRIGDMAFWVARDGRFSYVNDALCRTLGYARGELLGMTVFDCDIELVAGEWDARWLDIARRGAVVFETHLKTRQGRRFPVEISVNCVEVDGSQFHCGFARDVTDRKAAQEEVRASEERFRAMAETVPDVLFTLRPDGWCDYVNRRAHELFGVEPRSLEGYMWARIVHPDDVDAATALLMRSVRSGAPMTQEFRVRVADGSYRWLVSRMNPIRDPGGQILRWLGTAVDIDEQKRAQDALQKASVQLEQRVRERTAEMEAANAALRDEIAERRRLESEILRISEMEQRRIGQDLHDGLCQQLAGIAYLADSLPSGPEQDLRGAPRKVRRVRDLLHQALAEAREVARGLSPLKVEAQGLMSALKDLASATRRNHGVRCRLICSRPVLVEDVARATHLYRIAQEAVHNAIRHGRAKSIRIALAASDGLVRLRIEDDGRGVRRSARQGKGMGLASMTSRARSLGGRFDIRNRAEGGVSVSCVAPLIPAPLPESKPAVSAPHRRRPAARRGPTAPRITQG